jgi:hypothetical protein
MFKNQQVMKKIVLLVAMLLLITDITSAQFFRKSVSKKSADIESIKKMCGCFEVTFKFGETFAADTAYRFHDNYTAYGLEWVELVEATDDKLVLQHLLVVNDTTVIKHWRQDWLYENTDLLRFDRDNRWVRTTLPKSEVRGQWTQKVYQVDDSPRYEGSATWVHVDGKHFWESTADAPLPRREFSKRSDYNVLRRGNRHEITSNGWVHEQNNDKIVRNDTGDRMIAQEKGWNPYIRVDNSRCQSAQVWWAQHRNFWADVRKEWEKIFLKEPVLSLHPKIEKRTLWEHLDSAENEKVSVILKSFVKKIDH